MGAIMKYKVRRIDVKSDNMQDKLENFLQDIRGEVISIFPNVKSTFQLMGATAKIDYLLVVVKEH